MSSGMSTVSCKGDSTKKFSSLPGGWNKSDKCSIRLGPGKVVPDKVNTVRCGIRDGYPDLCLDREDFDRPVRSPESGFKETEGGDVLLYFLRYGCLSGSRHRPHSKRAGKSGSRRYSSKSISASEVLSSIICDLPVLCMLSPPDVCFLCYFYINSIVQFEQY